MANPGSMLGMCVVNSEVRLSESRSESRKYRFTVEAVLINETWIGCNTMLANTIVRTLLQNTHVHEGIGFPHFDAFKREVKNVSSRFDFLLSRNTPKQNIFLEVKTVTLASDWLDVESTSQRADQSFKNIPEYRPEECNLRATALFPDCKSLRALKHLNELMHIRKIGKDDAMLVYVIMRDDIDCVTASSFCDPSYAARFHAALETGLPAVGLRMRFHLSDCMDSFVELLDSVPVLKPPGIIADSTIKKQKTKKLRH